MIFLDCSESFGFRFVYESTGQEPSYANWKLGQPNNAEPGQDCAKVHMEENNYWFDDVCDNSHYFVCEKGIPELNLVCTISFLFFRYSDMGFCQN